MNGQLIFYLKKFLVAFELKKNFKYRRPTAMKNTKMHRFNKNWIQFCHNIHLQSKRLTSHWMHTLSSECSQNIYKHFPFFFSYEKYNYFNCRNTSSTMTVQWEEEATKSSPRFQEESTGSVPNKCKRSLFTNPESDTISTPWHKRKSPNSLPHRGRVNPCLQ